MSGEEADQAARFHIAVTHPLFANEGPAAKGPAGMFWWWIRRRCFHFAGAGGGYSPKRTRRAVIDPGGRERKPVRASK